jgi:hypothetical protein
MRGYSGCCGIRPPSADGAADAVYRSADFRRHITQFQIANRVQMTAGAARSAGKHPGGQDHDGDFDEKLHGKKCRSCKGTDILVLQLAYHTSEHDNYHYKQWFLLFRYG